MANIGIIILIISLLSIVICIIVAGYLIYSYDKSKQDLAQLNCSGRTTTAACYNCMVPAANKDPSCPDCTIYPSDPTCVVDCTLMPQNDLCPSCKSYPDAPGCLTPRR